MIKKRFSPESGAVGVDKSKKSKKSKKIEREADYLDLDNLDLDRAYTFNEFEIINDQLKNRSLKIELDNSSEPVPVNHFQLNKSGKLVPMPQSPITKELAVMEIARQLGNWNIQTNQNGAVTCSQGGFKIETGEIVAPDAAFTPKDTYRNLTDQQCISFQGSPFSPTFVVEVENINDIGNSKGKKLDSKFKDTYFASNTSVKLGWLIDPMNKKIWVYKRNPDNNKVVRRQHQWRDLDGGDTLPGFKLEVWEIQEARSQVSGCSFYAI